MASHGPQLSQSETAIQAFHQRLHFCCDLVLALGNPFKNIPTNSTVLLSVPWWWWWWWRPTSPAHHPGVGPVLRPECSPGGGADPGVQSDGDPHPDNQLAEERSHSGGVRHPAHRVRPSSTACFPFILRLPGGNPRVRKPFPFLLLKDTYPGVTGS